MSLMNKIRMDLHDKAMLEYLSAENKALSAFVEYNIMMGNIEDPSDDEESEDE